MPSPPHREGSDLRSLRPKGLAPAVSCDGANAFWAGIRSHFYSTSPSSCERGRGWLLLRKVRPRLRWIRSEADHGRDGSAPGRTAAKMDSTHARLRPRWIGSGPDCSRDGSGPSQITAEMDPIWVRLRSRWIRSGPDRGRD